MNLRPSLLKTLRQERHPLAILVMLALGLRVTILMIGLSVTPGLASDGFGVLCQSTQTGETGLPRGGQHDPAHCICGISCSHIGQMSAVLADAVLYDARIVPSGKDHILRVVTPIHVASRRPSGPIRAPPVSLT